VSEIEQATNDRRSQNSIDRRRNSRSGRRKNDPHLSQWHWRRVAWLFAASAAFMSLRRSVPATVKRVLTRRRTT